MFVKLACKNIRRSIKDYAIYFFTLALGVAIFYVFNAIETQTVMLDVSERMSEMLRLVNVIMRTVSIFVSCILGALIIYASRFLIKRRSKEFGIYLTLGMSKRKISQLVLLETLLIGLLSLAAGLILGAVLSQFVSILVANMFDANMANFHFVFSVSSFVQTLIYFGIIYFVVMIFNTIVIGRQKLINLLSLNRRNEVIKLKNPWVCTIIFAIAAIILGFAYYFVTDGLVAFAENSEGPEILLVPIGMGVVATFMLFWSLSGLLLRIGMSFNKFYFKKLNSFILRQFSSKINTTVISMSLICLMLFSTICILGSALSISTNLHRTIESALPVDVQVTSFGQSRAPSIASIYEEEEINLDDILQDRAEYKITEIAEITLQDTIGESYMPDQNNAEYIEAVTTSSEKFIYLSDYNRAARLFQLPELELNANEYAIIANFKPTMQLRNYALAAGQPITINNQILLPKLDHCIEGALELDVSELNDGIIIIPDQILIPYHRHNYVREILVGNFAADLEKETIEKSLNIVENRFMSNDEDGGDLYYLSVSTRQEIIDNNIGTSALVTFVGLYLGIIFLISSAAILALKELSESSDNRAKYAVLNKIGASRQTLNRALFWQIFIFFVFPLLIAILHSIFGLKFCNFMLTTLGGIDILNSVPMVVGILIIIYGGYFALTYFCSKNIIHEHRN